MSRLPTASGHLRISNTVSHRYIAAFTIFEKIYVTNTQTLLCTLPCLSTLQGHLFKPHNDPMKDALLLPLLYRWGNWGTEKLTCPGSQSPKGTVKTWIQADSRFYCNYCAISLTIFIFRHLFIKPHLSRWKGIIPSPANEKLKSSETEALRITENF